MLIIKNGALMMSLAKNSSKNCEGITACVVEVICNATTTDERVKSVYVVTRYYDHANSSLDESVHFNLTTTLKTQIMIRNCK